MTTDNLTFSQNVTYRTGGYYTIGKMVFIQFRLIAARDITGTGSTTLFTGLPKPQHYVDTSLSDETSAIGIWTMYSNSKMQSDIKIYINNIGDAVLSGDRTTIPAGTIIGFSGVYLARE